MVVMGKKLVVVPDQNFLDVNMMFYGSKKSILNKAVTKSFNDIETFK
jgi:hypothetical protein